MADKIDPALREVFRLAYLYRQRFQNPTRDPHFWRNAAHEMSVMVAQCNGHPFARGIFLACYQDIQRELLDNERRQQTPNRCRGVFEGSG